MAEAAVCLSILTPAIIFIAILVMDVSLELLHRFKVQHIANKVVAHICYDSITWNNGMRPRTSRRVVERTALAFLNTEFADRGLGTAKNVSLKYQGNIMVLSFRLPGRKTILSAFRIGPTSLPNVITAAGVVPTDSPPAYVTITVDNNLSKSIVIPAYGPHAGAFTNARLSLQQRLRQGVSNYARLLPNQVDGYGQCELDHKSPTSTYSFYRHS